MDWDDTHSIPAIFKNLVDNSSDQQHRVQKNDNIPYVSRFDKPLPGPLSNVPFLDINPVAMSIIQ